MPISAPHRIAAASLATSVPAIPIANPTSAFFNAGASFVPSPVTATTCPLSINPVTNAYLSSGLLLANTSKCGYILSNSDGLAIVSTLTSLFSFFAVVLSLAHGHTAVLHFAHTTPPIFAINSGPSNTKD